MNERDFALKVYWEGGVVEALEYGLRPGDCEPGELRAAYLAAYEIWRQMQPLVRYIEDLMGVTLDAAGSDELDI